MNIEAKITTPNESTTKFRHRTYDGHRIESAWHIVGERHILMVSTQIGCAIQCNSCAEEGLVRSLTAAEIVQQCLNMTGGIDFNRFPYLVSFSCMGGGDPLQREEILDSTVEALETLFARHWSVPTRAVISSTVPNPRLAGKLAKMDRLKAKVKFQFSLWAAEDPVRKLCVGRPAPMRNIAPMILELVRAGFRVDLNQILCHEINDSVVHAEKLAELIKPWFDAGDERVRLKFNTLNKVAHSPYDPSSPERATAFKAVMERRGIDFLDYSTAGTEADAGCGQIKGESKDELSVP